MSMSHVSASTSSQQGGGDSSGGGGRGDCTEPERVHTDEPLTYMLDRCRQGYCGFGQARGARVDASLRGGCMPKRESRHEREGVPANC